MTVSVFPHRSSDSAAASLRAAGGQPIPSWGTRTIPLSFFLTSNTTHRFNWSFTLAAVDRLILGADFLRHHQFDVSLACHLLVPVNVSPPLMSSSSFLLCFPRFPSSTRRLWQSSWKLLALALRPALSSMMFATMLRPVALPSPPRRAAWTSRSMQLQRLSLRRWRRLPLLGGVSRLGPLPFTWY